MEVAGWLVRLGGGTTRRTNSINPLQCGPRDPSAVLERLIAPFRAAGANVIFRVPDIAHGMAEALTAAGIETPEAETRTLFTDLSVLPEDDGSAELLERPAPGWLAARAKFNDAGRADSAVYRETVASIALPVRFAATRHHGEIASVAYGVISGRLLVVESVVTAPEARGRGLARKAVAGLMRWAAAAGAQGACLQVVAGNEPAIALYRALGFDSDLYRYHYRRLTER